MDRSHDTLNHSRQPINWRNFTTCLFIGFGLFVYGYFTGIISTTLTKTDFLLYMGLIDTDGNATPGSTGLIGATTSIYSAGGFIGVISAGWILDRFGRKFALIYSSVLCIVSCAVLTASQNIGMFIALRFFTGMGAYSFNLISPVYTAELAPSKLRGFLVGLSGIWCAVGFAVSTYFGIAFFSLNGVASWRVPLGLGMVWPLLILIGSYCVPESPRYLLLSGKEDAARFVTLNQHTIHGEETFAKAEFLQMRRQAEMDKELDSTWLSFLKPHYRKRASIVIILAIIGQSSGNLVINNYGGILYSSLGYDTYYQLIFQCGYITAAVVFAIVGSFLVDRIGRRMLLFIGLSGCAISLAIEAAIVAVYAPAGTNRTALSVGVAALFLFESFYSVSVDICYFVISVELFPTHLRAKGTTLAFSSTVLTNVVFLQAAPTAFANIGWKYFLVFIVITVAGIVWIYFVVPESSQMPLEEMADVFGINTEVAIRAKDIHIDATKSEVIADEDVQDGDNSKC